MSATDAAATALLAVGVLAVLVSVVGVLVMRDPYDRLHYTGPANTVAPIAIAAAAALSEGLTAASLKAGLICAIVLFTSPLLVHATARAGRVREHGRWLVRDAEEER